MTEQDFSKWPETKVVRSHEVENSTLMGWQLIGVVESSEVESSYREEWVEENSYSRKEMLNTPLVIRQPLFILGRDEQTVIDSLRSSANESRQKAIDLQKELDDLCKQRDELEDIGRRTKSVLDERAAEIDRKYKENNEQRERLRKMEDDLAKIRKAVGDLRMKEILATED